MGRGSPGWLLAAALSLSGCTGGLFGGSEPVGSGAVRDAAYDAASDWAQDAVLMTVMGFEKSPQWVQHEEQVQGRGDPGPSDPRVGDGRAPHWRFVFISDERLAMKTFIFHGSRLQTSEQKGLPPGVKAATYPRLDGWTLESDQAMKRVAEDQPRWGKLPEGKVGYSFIVLDRRWDSVDNPFWRFKGRDGLMGDLPMVMVDAITGEVKIECDPHLAPETGRAQGSVSPVFPMFGREFKLEGACARQVVVTLTLSERGTGGKFNVTVTGPEGVQRSKDVTRAPTDGKIVSKLGFDVAPRGKWDVVVRGPETSYQDFEIAWAAG